MNHTALLLRAASFAAHKHRDQRRKDAASSPYINHPLALACVLCVDGGVTDVATLCAALLHDTVEDTDTTPAELEATFGAEIRAIVQEVCNVRDVASSPPERWTLQRRQAYFDWAREVVDRLRGVNPKLEALFDAAYAARPG
jgi:GTP diphosphokinase / guanosine-3',5'-bis(diphosphate) 3'-diphosphatase